MPLDVAPGSILDDLSKDAKWDEFLDHLISDLDEPEDMMATESLIRKREYRPIVDAIVNGTYVFPIPTKYEIPKPGKKTKRNVYTFKERNSIVLHTVLRMMSWLFNRYSDHFSSNLYSCSENDGVRGAVNCMVDILSKERKYCYKADLTDFFNAINVDMLFEDMYPTIDPVDHNALGIIEKVVKNPKVIAITLGGDRPVKAEIEEYHKGVMAGMPFASFLSNYFLKDMDWMFYNIGIPYFRYADDIVILADSPEELDAYARLIDDTVEVKRLLMNPDKVDRYGPDDAFIFLGVKFRDGMSMITDKSIMTQKRKAKWIAKRCRRLYEKGRCTRDEAMVKSIRMINSYFYGSSAMPYSFSNMYFPMFTSSEGLGIVDSYVQECIRYVYMGKFRTSNRGRVPYDKLRLMGYIPLVSAYRQYRELRYGRCA